MSRRLVVAALLVTFAFTAAAEKRRATGPSENRCVEGVLDIDVFVQNIALDATHVYYYDSFDGEVFRVPEKGGARVGIAEFLFDFVTDIAVDDTNVYVATLPPPVLGGDFLPGAIYSVPKNGGTVRVIATAVPFPVKLVTDATHVYWVSVGTLKLSTEEILSDGKIERVRKDGTGREALASGLSAPLTFALDDTSVFFSESGSATGNPSIGMRRVAKTGGSVQEISNNFLAGDLEVAGNDLVFFGAGADFETTGIYRMPKAGGAGTLLVADEEIAAGPRIFDGQVYYLTLDPDELVDKMMRVPLAGGLAQFLYSPDLDGADFEVDACGIVYGNYFGELRRSGK